MSSSHRFLLAGLALTLLSSTAWAAPETLSLANGDKVTGEIVSRSDREVVIEHSALGRLVIPAEALAPMPEDKPGLLGTRVLRGWSRTLGLGLTGSEGNTDESSLRISLGLDRETDDTRWNIEGAYKISTADDDRDDHFGHVITRHDWLYEGSRWFARTGGQYFYDEFEDWKHRVGFMAGPGYQLIKRETVGFDLSAGLAATYEFGDKKQVRPEAYVGFELSWKPGEAHKLSFSNAFFQQLDESEIRNRTRAEWRMRILGSEHLSVIFGADNEYDSDADDASNNLRYWTSLDYSF